MISLERGKNLGMSYEQPSRRPGTVTGAAVIVIVLHSLFAIAALIGVIAGIMIAVSANTAAQAEDVPGMGPLVATVGGGGLAVIFALLLAFSVLMILFSVQAMRGRNWARIVSTVFLALGVLGNLGGMTQPVDQAGGQTGGSVLGLVLLAVALLLYWLPPSNRWYAALRGRAAGTPAVQPPHPGASPG